VQVTRRSIDTVERPADWPIGSIDAVAAAPAPSRVTADPVHVPPRPSTRATPTTPSSTG
jgi:hypothetical protein